MENQEVSDGWWGVVGDTPHLSTRARVVNTDLGEVSKDPHHPPPVAAEGGFDWGGEDAAGPSSLPGFAAEPLIPCMDAWVVFAWDEDAEAFRPTVVDVRQIEPREWHDWAQGVRDAGGFATPVCLDASDAHDQSRALFGAHGFKPGYADRRQALTEFARLVEADWARDALAKETK